MIAKKSKGNLVEDSHTINLIEAGFNFNNKTIARLTVNVLKKINSCLQNNIEVENCIA